MSWSSDIRCLYCDGRLPLYRKITNGQFCSAPHRKLYWQEQERLGVERLHETHDSLRAFRPPEGVQAILGMPLFEQTIEPAAEDHAPPPSGMIVATVAPKSLSPAPIAMEPFSYDADLPPLAPLWNPGIAAAVEVGAPAPMAGFVSLTSPPQPQWPTDRMEAAEPKPFLPAVSIRRPLRGTASPGTAVMAGGIAMIPVQPKYYQGGRPIEPISWTPPLPCREIPRAATPQGDALAPVVHEEDNVPRADSLVALTRFAAREQASNGARRDPWPAAPFSPVHRLHLPLGTKDRAPASAMPQLAGLRPLSIEQVPLVHGTWIDSLRALGTESSNESPRYELSTPALRPRLRLAAGSRYPVVTRDAALTVAAIEPESLRPSARIAIPERRAMTAAAGAASAGNKSMVEPAPSAAGLLPLASAKPNEPDSSHAAQSVNLPQPLNTAPLRPASHLEPIDAKPVSDFMKSSPGPEPTNPEESRSAADLLPPAAPDRREAAGNAWTNVAGFWKHAPRDLKLLVFGIPILLGLALHPSLKKFPFAAPPQVGAVQRNFKSKLNEQWVNVRQTMVDRAAIALDEDFRAGLDDWTSRGGTTDWAFDATGFVRPGPLALYRPSIDLTDYQMQFLGMIDKKALSWVVRAADFDDYYVVKLVVLKPGPVPTIGVTRYAVIHGVAQDRADTMALINAREDMLYRVRMDIHGDMFALTVQGQLIDSWTEPRLRKGGVGFFTARGEASRLRWVQVTHQYDMLGRLCAYLAPYDIPSTNGGWQP